MADENEERILVYDLIKSSPGGMIIKDIASELHLNRDTVARHLRVLLMKGDVESKQVGPAKIFYKSKRIPESVLNNFCPLPQVYFNRFMQVHAINKEFRRLAGPVPEIIVGKKPEELKIPLFDDESLRENYDTAMKGRSVVKYVSTALNDKEYYFRVYLLPVVMESGRAGICLVLSDKTDSLGEKSMSEKGEDFYRNIVEDQTDFICRVLPDGTFTYANRAYCRMRDRPLKELVGHKALPLNLSRVIDESQVISADNPVITEDIQVILPNGEISWQQWKIRGIFNSSGSLSEYLLAGRDFTELKRAEEKIRMYHSNLEILIKERTSELRMINRQLIDEVAERKETEERLRLALEGSKYFFWDWDLITGRVIFGRKMAETLGFLPGEMGSDIDAWRMRVHPDDLEHVLKAQEDHFEGHRDFYEAEYRMMHRDGYYLWMYAIGRVSSRKADGTPMRMSGLQSDISSKIQVKRGFDLQKNLINALSGISVFKEAVDVCLFNTIKYTDLDSGCYYRYENEKLSLLSFTEELFDDTGELKEFSPEGLLETEDGSRGSFYVQTEAVRERYEGLDFLNRFGSIAIIPVGGERVEGMFCFFSKESREIPESIRNTLDSTAKLIQGTLSRIKTDEDIEKGRQHLALALKNSRMAIWEIDLSTDMMTFYYAGRKCGENTGRLCLKEMTVPWKKSILPGDREGVLNTMNDHISGRSPFYRSTHRVLSGGGSIRVYTNTGTIDRWDEKNRPVRISGMSVDITDEKRSEG